MITIIYGKPGYGKTSLMTYFLNEYCFDKIRNRMMRKSIIQKNKAGFNLDIPQHCVSANIDLNMKKPGYSIRKNRRIDPFKLGHFNKKVETHFNFPFEVIGIDEAQKYFPAKEKLPDYQSLWFEQHRHDDLEIILCSQRPMRIHKNIRDNAIFIEVLSKSIKQYRNGKVKIIWNVRKIYDNSTFELYYNTGSINNKLYENAKIVCNYNIYKIYNSREFEVEFYRGKIRNNFDIKYSETVIPTYDGFVEYLEKFEEGG